MKKSILIKLTIIMIYDIGNDPDYFEILQVLGAGTFGQVFKVLSKKF